MRGNRWACTFALLGLLGSAAGAQTDARDLYDQLAGNGLDAAQTYEIRDANLDLEDIHITLDQGTISFMQPVAGHVTGAFFQGDGEILIIPPDQAERASLALFTGAAVLEERFSGAYLRFDDEIAARLKQDLRPAPSGAGFAAEWDATVKSLAPMDALRLLMQFTNRSTPPERFLHARFTGLRLGIFDVFLDSTLPEQISVAQTGYTGHGAEFYDVWMSFPMQSRRHAGVPPPEDPLAIDSYKLRVRVLPSHEIQADALVNAQARAPGMRTLAFELSRFLKISEVKISEVKISEGKSGELAARAAAPNADAGGRELEFIQNPAIPGSALARRGNDVMAVVLPRALADGEKIQLDFRYAGSVISEAGNGLLYVGARGDWYPNRGPAMARFDLEFRYPQGLTLLATGQRVAFRIQNGRIQNGEMRNGAMQSGATPSDTTQDETTQAGATQGSEQVARWISAKPIPLAGFNLGKFRSASANFEGVAITSYSPPPPPQLAAPPALVATSDFASAGQPPAPPPPPPPPAAPVPPLEQRSTRSLRFLSGLFGQFPYPELSLTPLPGPNSQGWPGLIFLSNFCYFPPPLPASLGFNYSHLLFAELMPTHEIAHQWWGDAMLWQNYHDQWLMESMANYAALLEARSRNPEAAARTLDHYRDELIQPAGEHGKPYTEAGPVTLGVRLSSSHFPEGFERVLYERGAWLMRMLRAILDTPGAGEGAPWRPRGAATEPLAERDAQAPFFRAMRELEARFAGRRVSTADFQAECEKFLPADARYEKQNSLDWFFQGWVNGDAVPKLELKDVRLDQRRRRANALLTQTEAPPDLVTLVPIYAEIGARSSPVFVARVFADGAETKLQLTLPPNTKKLLLDPYNTILRRP